MTALPTVTSENTLSNSFLGSNMQICVVTRDFMRTMEGLVRTGIGPWRVYTFGPETMTEITYRGRPSRHAMKLGLAFSGSMMWEIVQPLAGPNIYEEFLDAHGEGIHHVAFDCNHIPWPEQLKAFADRGYTMIQSGLWQGKYPHAYFETEGDTTTTFEIFQVPADFVWPEPEQWYPGPPPAA
ncbi:MAG: VOC family protein [Alphaproteobacteria bacterium]